MNTNTQALITENVEVVGRVVAREMARGVPPWVDRSDLESVAQLALVTAAVKFDHGCDFKAYAYNHVRTAVLHELSAIEVRNRGRSEMPADVDVQPSRGGDLDLYAALSALPPREYCAIVLHYWGGSSQTDIAVTMGVSQPTVGNILRSAKKSIKEFINLDSQGHIHTKGEERPHAA